VSSLLFSPTCLNPLQGLVDFAKEVKPFHTKILETTQSFAFRDDIEGEVTETLYKLIEQRFNLHRDDCVPDSTPCYLQGFEVGLFDGVPHKWRVQTLDDLESIPIIERVPLPGTDQELVAYVIETNSFWIVDDVDTSLWVPYLGATGSTDGWEPTLVFSYTTNNTGYPTGTTSASGQPLFFLFPEICVEDREQLPRYQQTTVTSISTDNETGAIRITLLRPSLVEDRDIVNFPTISSRLVEITGFNTTPGAEPLLYIPGTGQIISIDVGATISSDDIRNIKFGVLAGGSYAFVTGTVQTIPGSDPGIDSIIESLRNEQFTLRSVPFDFFSGPNIVSTVSDLTTVEATLGSVVFVEGTAQHFTVRALPSSNPSNWVQIVDIPTSFFTEHYELVKQDGTTLTSTLRTTIDLEQSGYDVRLRDADQAACPEGFERHPYEAALYESGLQSCIDTCDGIYAGPKQDPSVASPTTIDTVVLETISIVDDLGGTMEVL
jgi:hypothetical protein